MTNETTENYAAEEYSGHPIRPHRKPRNLMFKVRNVLNTLFIIGAVAGIVYTLRGDRTVGFYIVCVSMVLKFVESAIRLLKL